MPKDTHIEFIARGLLIHKGRVLLCRNEKHGYHYLPGGHIEFGERADDALKRELIEECSLPCCVGPLLLTTEQVFRTKKREHHEINLVFHMEHKDGAAALPETIVSNESQISFVWADLAGLVDMDLRPEDIKAWLVSGGKAPPASGPFLSGISSPCSMASE